MGKTRRLLIVDDSIELVEAAGAAMEARGFEVNRASNAFAGVRLAATDPPDAIVMDLDMPGMDGIEAAMYLKRIDETRDIPVIAFTGQSVESIAAPATRPFTRIISKASGFDVLEHAIDAVLDGPR